MAVVADRVVVELEAKLDRYNANIVAADQKFTSAMSRIQKSAGAAEAFVRRAAGGMTAAIGSIGLAALGAQAVETALRFQRFEKGLEVATGSASAAGQEIKFLRDLSDQLGVRFITLAENFTGVAAAARGTALEGENAREVFEAVTKAIIATGGSAEQIDGALLAVEQIISKGNVSAEELRGQLGERLPGAFQIAARALSVTTAELDKMLQKGDVVSTDFLPKFAAQLGKELPSNLQTADASFQRFQTALDDIANSTADGFMKELGDATDDLTQTLKEMQQSGALEAVGSFLGEVIRLGSGAIGVIGDLALAWKRFRLEVGIRQQQGIESGFLTSAADKEEARRNRVRLEAELIRLSGKAKPSFAQGSLDSLDKIIAAQGKSATRTSGPSASGSGGKKVRSKIDIDAFSREEAALNDAILRLKGVELTNADDRARVELQRIDEAKNAAIADVKTDKRYTEAQKAKIIALTEAVASLEAGKVIYQRDVETAREALDIRLNALRNQQDLLRAEADLAGTREQRRDIELRLLDLAYQQERAELDAVIASKDASDAQKKIAQARLDALGAMQQAETEGVNRQYEGPLARYRRRMDETSTSDQVEELVTQELDYVRNGIRDSITKRLGIKDPLLAGLLDMFIQQNIIRPLAASLQGQGGGGFLGSLASLGSSFFGSAGGGELGTGVGFASGGSGVLGGRGGTDRNVLSLNGRPFANVSRGETLSVGSKALRGSAAIQQTVVNYIGPGAKEFWGSVDARSARVASPIARTESSRAATASYAQSQQSAPGTINKYSQLKG